MEPQLLDPDRVLPEGLRVLARALPRHGWQAHPNFDGLTRFWMERHAMFREILRRLESGGQSYLEGDRDGREHARETARYAGALLNELHGHHQIEDVHYFPVLRGLDPRLSAGFDLLDADHTALDGRLHALADTANAFLGAVGRPSERDRAGALHAALTGFAPVLNRHLEDEEDLVVPVILTHAPAL